MRILVTGGGGFQGSHLVQRWIDAGHDVTVLNTRSEMSIANLSVITGAVAKVWGSVTDKKAVDGAARDQDVVVHLAARINVDESNENPGTVLEVNVMGTYNVLEAVREGGQRLVYSSSCEVYGGDHEMPIRETAVLRPHSVYAASKTAADRLCHAYWKSYDVDVCILRPSNVYGQRQKGGSGGAVIPRFVDRASRGQPLRVFGSGKQRREFMHIDDLVSAYDLVLKTDGLAGEVINIGSGETRSIRDVARRIGDHFSVPVEYGAGRPGEIDRFELDSSKAARLGFSPQVSFEEGLGRYLEWRTSQLDLSAGNS